MVHVQDALPSDNQSARECCIEHPEGGPRIASVESEKYSDCTSRLDSGVALGCFESRVAGAGSREETDALSQMCFIEGRAGER